MCDNPGSASIHPSIPQGERRPASVSLRFSVRGEVSNHEWKGVLSVPGHLSDTLQGRFLLSSYKLPITFSRSGASFSPALPAVAITSSMEIFFI